MTDISPSSESPLDDEALKAADEGGMMARMLAEARERNALSQQPVRRGPGRPPGAKNRSKLVAPGQARIPMPPQIPGKEQPQLTPEQLAEQARLKREAKKERVQELTVSIADGLNEKIVMSLVGMGVSSKLLYKPGMEPKKVAATSPYSEFVGNVLISPNQAETWAHFLVELEGTKIGKQFTDATGSGNGPLLLYGALSVLAAVQYVQGLQTFYRQLKPVLEAYQAAQAQTQARAQQAQNGGQQ